MYLFKLEFSPDIVRLLDHVVTLFSVFQETFILFSIVDVPNPIPTNCVERVSF